MSSFAKMPRRGRNAFLTASLAFLIGAGALVSSTSQARADSPPERKQCDTATGKQECCSAKNCGGHVVSNRDEHNCKKKSKGKSWHDAGGTCTNL